MWLAVDIFAFELFRGYGAVYLVLTGMLQKCQELKFDFSGNEA